MRPVVAVGTLSAALLLMTLAAGHGRSMINRVIRMGRKASRCRTITDMTRMGAARSMDAVSARVDGGASSRGISDLVVQTRGGHFAFIVELQPGEKSRHAWQPEPKILWVVGKADSHVSFHVHRRAWCHQNTGCFEHPYT